MVTLKKPVAKLQAKEMRIAQGNKTVTCRTTTYTEIRILKNYLRKAREKAYSIQQKKGLSTREMELAMEIKGRTNMIISDCVGFVAAKR